MDDYKKTCCVTGHRPNGFPWNYKNVEFARHQEYLESMACYIDYYVRKHNVNYFISGGTIGVDTDFAKIVIDLRDHKYDEIKLEIAAPYREQDKRWSEQDKTTYKKILKAADSVTYISETYSPSCIFKRNKYMIDKSDIVFAFWNKNKKTCEPFKTIEYARQQNKFVEFFILNDY